MMTPNDRQAPERGSKGVFRVWRLATSGTRDSITDILFQKVQLESIFTVWSGIRARKNPANCNYSDHSANLNVFFIMYFFTLAPLYICWSAFSGRLKFLNLKFI